MSPHVSDVSQAEFADKVLARSRQVPVVVDFWAGWCAPCRMLGPTLEREVAALGGRVELAKVDVDQAQELSAQFEVRGIPAVMAFRDGKVVAEFTGARDAAFVRDFLSQLAPSEAARRLSAAKTEAELRALLDDTEVGPRAALRLGEVLLSAGKASEAVRILEQVPPRAVGEYAAAETLRAQAALALDAEAFGGEAKARAAVAANEGDVTARWALACALASKGDPRGALEHYLEVVSRDRAFKDDGARKAMLALFERLGPQSDLVREYRRRLQVVL